jgi:hypothetical protein
MFQAICHQRKEHAARASKTSPKRWPSYVQFTRQWEGGVPLSTYHYIQRGVLETVLM